MQILSCAAPCSKIWWQSCAVRRPNDAPSNGWHFVSREGILDFIFRHREEAVIELAQPKIKVDGVRVPSLKALKRWLQTEGNWYLSDGDYGYWTDDYQCPIKRFF